jgi:hypothetical protein
MIQSAGRLAAGVLLTGLLGLVSAQTAAQGIYTCVDARGRKITADRPIADCLDREQQVLNPSGSIKAKVGPSLTAQERAELEAKEKRNEQERARRAEEKRWDRALLMRYPARAVHDRERAEALAQIKVVTNAASRRIDELLRQRAAIDREMEFYVKDPSKAPPSIRRQLEENAHSQAVQKRFIADQETETRRMNARFDEELARLQTLWLRETAAARADAGKMR